MYNKVMFCIIKMSNQVLFCVGTKKYNWKIMTQHFLLAGLCGDFSTVLRKELADLETCYFIVCQQRTECNTDDDDNTQMHSSASVD